jgi:GNAT superfamily N-acetyltransferase
MKPRPNGFEIRDATVADADALAEIHVEAWEAAYRGILPDELIESRDLEFRKRNWSERLPNLPDDEFVRVGVLDGRVVAFSNGAHAEGEPEDTAIGRLLYMRNEVKGRGIGTHMRADILEQIKQRGFNRVIYWIVKGNEEAERFYADPRFKRTGVERPMEGGRFTEIGFAQDLRDFEL